MESVCVGTFILIFLVAISIIASPISVVVGAITYSIRKNGQHRLIQAVVVALFTFLFIILLACMALLIWDPQI
jgi:hypothetical protein